MHLSYTAMVLKLSKGRSKMALITIYTATLKGCLKHYFIKDEAEAAESGIEEDERLDNENSIRQ